MAEETPTWGYTRIQGALKNVGHRVGRSTIAPILRASGTPPVPERSTSWQTFLRAHWGAIAGADFFTTEVKRRVRYVKGEVSWSLASETDCHLSQCRRRTCQAGNFRVSL